MNTLAYILPVFLACTVEAVEALTLVLASGRVSGWRASLSGALAGLLIVGVLIGTLGAGLSALALPGLQLLIGAVFLIVGGKWLRKALLRAAGRLPKHDEALIYTQALNSSEKGSHAFLGGFLLSMQGVLTEGLEIVLIVVGVGIAQHHAAAASFAAVAAVLVVVCAGFAVRRPLARVPENTLKLAVGVMLVSFGAFWSCEGAGLAMSEAILPAMVAAVLCGALLAAHGLRRETVTP